jgi:hypothetical protein
LTKRARNYLAKEHRVSVRDITWKPVGTYNNDQHLPHRLAVTDFRISVYLAVERLGYELKTWLGESELQNRHRKYKIRLLTDPDDSSSRERVETLEPDGHWWLHTDKNFFHFNEIDRCTETLQYVDPNRKNEYWAWKIRKYGAFYDEWYEQLYPEAKKSMRILVVTTTDTRLDNMIKVCRKVAGRRAAGRYWLTTFSRIAPSYQDYFRETVLTGPIWQRADQPGQLRPLVW